MGTKKTTKSSKKREKKKKKDKIKVEQLEILKKSKSQNKETVPIKIEKNKCRASGAKKIIQSLPKHNSNCNESCNLHYTEEQLKQLFSHVHNFSCESPETCDIDSDELEEDMTALEKTLNEECERERRLNYRKSLKTRFEENQCRCDRLSSKSN